RRRDRRSTRQRGRLVNAGDAARLRGDLSPLRDGVRAARKSSRTLQDLRRGLPGLRSGVRRGGAGSALNPTRKLLSHHGAFKNEAGEGERRPQGRTERNRVFVERRRRTEKRRQ